MSRYKVVPQHRAMLGHHVGGSLGGKDSDGHTLPSPPGRGAVLQPVSAALKNHIGIRHQKRTQRQ